MCSYANHGMGHIKTVHDEFISKGDIGDRVGIDSLVGSQWLSQSRRSNFT